MTAPSQAESPVEKSDSGPSVRPAMGRPPVAVPAAGYVGPIIALLVLAAGVIAVRDAVVWAGWLHGRLWVSAAIGWIDGLTFRWWMYPVGVVAIIVGGWWIYAALRPRHRTAIPISAQTGVWITPAAVARIASRAAETVPGVLEAHASAGLRRITIKARITADSGDTEIKAAVADAVRSSTSSLATSMRVVVRAHTGGR